MAETTCVETQLVFDIFITETTADNHVEEIPCLEARAACIGVIALLPQQLRLFRLVAHPPVGGYRRRERAEYLMDAPAPGGFIQLVGQ